jgi:hypothetical protein
MKLKSFLRRDECIYKDSTHIVGPGISNKAQLTLREERKMGRGRDCKSSTKGCQK